MNPTIKRIIKSTLPFTILRVLPNGVRDQIVENKVLRKVRSYTLVAGDITAFTDGTNVTFITIKKPLTYSGYGFWTGPSSNPLDLWFVGVTGYGNGDNVINIGQIAVNNQTLFIYTITKGTYADLAAAKTALAGTVIYYQLATPIYESYNGFPPSM